MESIKHDLFGMPEGKQVERFILNNSKGITTKVINMRLPPHFP